jgi:hypothetical protein
VSPSTGAGTVFLPVGSFDISPGGVPGSVACDTSYVVNLLVNSNLRANAKYATGRAEPNYLRIHSAEVHLMTLQKETILFNRNPKTTLPNPFTVTTANVLSPSDGTSPSRGLAVVEAIPSAYADQLDRFKDKQIIAEITIFGTTLGDVDIDFKPFAYPIQLCDGCLTLCHNRDILLNDLDLDEVYGMDCRDNAGQDGRICVDNGC